MTQLTSVVKYFDSLLTPREYTDYAYNGLQVESTCSNITCVAFAVDSGLSVIEEAVSKEADLLVVHHGILWGEPIPITGTFGAKVNSLLHNKCSLYASHLPLDGHREVGNGFEFARYLELEAVEGFCEYKGTTIGARGKCGKSKNLEHFVEKCSEIDGAISPVILPFGVDTIQSVGIVTGSGTSALSICPQEGIDLLISGEAKQEAYHLAKELRVNALFVGHYASETFGVKSLQKRIEKDFEMGTVFIHEPTGI